jgi:hypothetical protein
LLPLACFFCFLVLLIISGLFCYFQGKHVSTDAMFRLAARSKNKDEVCYVFAMGEDHHICRFWGLDSDSDDALLPGLKQVSTSGD